MKIAIKNIAGKSQGELEVTFRWSKTAKARRPCMMP